MAFKRVLVWRVISVADVASGSFDKGVWCKSVTCLDRTRLCLFVALCLCLWLCVCVCVCVALFVSVPPCQFPHRPDGSGATNRTQYRDSFSVAFASITGYQ